MHTEFWWENLRKRVLLEGQGVDGKIILILILGSEIWEKGLDWSDLG